MKAFHIPTLHHVEDVSIDTRLQNYYHMFSCIETILGYFGRDCSSCNDFKGQSRS